MPVILSPNNYDSWLNPRPGNTNADLELLKPCDPGLMRCYPVSTRVNQVQNDDANCAKLFELEGPMQRQLF
jgi:putative SOS response-associated peptidase YedK